MDRVPTDLAGMDLHELESLVESLGHRRFHARQIYRWIWKRGVTDIALMTDLGRELRESLAGAATISTPEVLKREISEDGTQKFVLRLADGRQIESVFIPDTPAQTFCISTQVGCAMGCAFCLTGKMGLVRHLTAGEIAGQVRVLARELHLLDQSFNIVLMGMGEPLHNYDATMKALRMLNEKEGFALNPRRVTLSTVGLVPMLDKLAKEPLMPNLAVSLHASTEAQRSAIVPPSKKHSLHDIIEACKRFPLKKRSRITFEYVMLAGVNDAPDDARRLAKLVAGIKAKVNLIPLNAAPGIPFERPSDASVDRFAAILADRHVVVSVRKSRGRDIRAACGQLIVEGQGKRRTGLFAEAIGAKNTPGLFSVFLLAVALLASACALEPRNWAEFTRQLRGMDPADRSAAVERYLAAHGGTPLVENQSRLIFVVQDVNGVTPRIVGDFNAWAVRQSSGQASTPPGADAPIGTPTRIDGTAWSYLESTAWTNARVEYVLLFEAADGAAKGSEARPDPLNPRLVQAFAGPRAEVRMPLWVAQPEIDDQAAVPPGELIAETLASRALGGTRRVWYYLPPGYDPSGDTLYPVVYVLDGGNYIEKMDVPRVLDRLIARKSILPVIAVFSEPGDRQEEYSRNAKWRTFIASELVPLVDKRFRTFPAPDHRVILGSSFAAYGAVDLAIEYPSVFGLCAALAPPEQTATIVANQPNARAAARSIRFFVLGGLYDSLIGGARRLRTTLDGADAAVTYVEVSEGHSTETFRGHLDEAIKALLAER